MARSVSAAGVVTTLSDARPVTVEAQGHLLKFTVRHVALGGGGGVRGAIREFSSQSRKRMLEQLARVDEKRAGFVCFVTLTYPDGLGPSSAEGTERDRRAFLKRIKRAHPKASAIWRREWEERESGAFVGFLYPHYHLLFFGLPFVPHVVIKETWREVIGSDGYLRTEIRGIESWRHAFYYVAKYMAKAAREGAEEGRGDTEGRGIEGGGAGGAPAPAGAAAAAASSLVYGTYLTGEDGQGGKIGRSWGVFNRRNLPLAERREITLPGGAWLELAKELAAMKYPPIRDYLKLGFTLFDDDPYGWLERLSSLPGDFTEDGEYRPVPF